MRWLCMLFLGITLSAAEDPGEVPAPVDDPIGLGERLALIDYLRARGQDIAEGASLADVRRQYWALEQAQQAPTRAEALEREALVRMREDIRDQFQHEADPNLDLAALRALKEQLNAQLLAQLQAEAASQASGEQSARVKQADLPSLRQAVVLIATPRSTGSGFFVDASGTLATNHHVIEGHQGPVQVYWDSSLKRPMERFEVIAADPERDVALLRPTQSGSTYRYLSLQKRYDMGAPVMAVGYPLGASMGQLLGTNAVDVSLSRGTLGAIRRRGDTPWWLQSDCAISQGSSGGPLIDAHSGAAIGLITLLVASSDAQAAGHSYTMAVPIDALGALLRSR